MVGGRRGLNQQVVGKFRNSFKIIDRMEDRGALKTALSAHFSWFIGKLVTKTQRASSTDDFEANQQTEAALRALHLLKLRRARELPTQPVSFWFLLRVHFEEQQFPQTR